MSVEPHIPKRLMAWVAGPKLYPLCGRPTNGAIPRDQNQILIHVRSTEAAFRIPVSRPAMRASCASVKTNILRAETNGNHGNLGISMSTHPPLEQPDAQIWLRLMQSMRSSRSSTDTTCATESWQVVQEQCPLSAQPPRCSRSRLITHSSGQTLPLSNHYSSS